jgi:asparagine synthase (glutamine-hydrolysing)
MCGILSVVSFSNKKNNIINYEVMLNSLAHRGPDGSDKYLFDGDTYKLYLGHRRLKIIDLTDNGKQPMSNEDGKIWVIFNGEIYNFKQLKYSLEKCGHIFKSNTDTEVIVHGYEEYGEQIFSKLDGMFSLIIWDSINEKLFTARDRTGKKPLFYYFTDNIFIAASEIKAILACSYVKTKVDINFLHEYFFLGYVPSPNTLFSDIKQINPGYYSVFDIKQSKITFHTYWDINNIKKTKYNNCGEAKERFGEIFDNAVKKRLVSDVPIGLLLSGGIDSSLVLESLKRCGHGDISTYSIGIGSKDLSYDETNYSSFISKYFDVPNHSVRFDVSPKQYLNKILYFIEQPFGDSASLPTFELCKFASNSIKVALNGDGADELFFGYDRFRAALYLSYLPRNALLIIGIIKNILPNNYGYNSLKRKINRFYDGSPITNCVALNTIKLMSIFNQDTILKLLNNDDYINKLNFFYDMKNEFNNIQGSSIDKILKLNFKYYLSGDLNVKMDRMSMANSLETRSPFLDTELIEFAFSLPDSLKLKNGVTKKIIREYAKNKIPKEILNRKKHGFGMPLGEWFKDELGEVFINQFITERPLSEEFIDISYVKQLYFNHISDYEDNSYKLWLLIQFESWLRLHNNRFNQLI